jgi:predicted nucleotide-binding protein
VDAVLAASLGQGSGTLASFRDVRYSIGFWTGSDGEAERDAEYFAEQVDRAAALIDAAVYELELSTTTTEAEEPVVPPLPISATAPIFVVHGREDARKFELVRLLDRTTDRDVRILHEQPNGGATVLEKLEHHVQAAGYAVVLLTADDEGRLRGEGDVPLAPRGRQNVIFELGVFIGALGRSRVAVLLEAGVEQPSDLSGLVYIPLDSGGWRVSLLKELANAGIKVDYGRIP